MPTGISSTFAIVSNDTVAAGQTLTITNPGRTMRVVSIRVCGTGTAFVAASKGAAGALGVAFASGAIAASPISGWTELTITYSLATILSTDEIRITSSGGTVNECVIECVGNPSQTLTSVVA